MNKTSRHSSALPSLLLAIAALATACTSVEGTPYDDPYWQAGAYGTRAPDPYADEAVGFFYDDLEPYGEWLYQDDLGWVWRPRGVSRDWQPYTDGRWVWSDDGWTWISDWEWGWAPFHYGRWTYLDTAWVWVPGLEWAPAWVTWRYGDGVIGWAPLPPRLPRYREVLVDPLWVDRRVVLPPTAFCFVDMHLFLEPRLHRHLAPRHRNARLIHATHTVTHYNFIDDRVVNRGPDFREVERLSRVPVKQYRLVNRDRPVRHGEQLKDNEVVVFRPSPQDKPRQRPKGQTGGVPGGSDRPENGERLRSAPTGLPGEGARGGIPSGSPGAASPPGGAPGRTGPIDAQPKVGAPPEYGRSPIDYRGRSYPTDSQRREVPRGSAPLPTGIPSDMGTTESQDGPPGQRSRPVSPPSPDSDARRPDRSREVRIQESHPEAARPAGPGAGGQPAVTPGERSTPQDGPRSAPRSQGGSWREVPREPAGELGKRDSRARPEARPPTPPPQTGRPEPAPHRGQESKPPSSGRQEPAKQENAPPPRERRSGEPDKRKSGQQPDEDKR